MLKFHSSSALNYFASVPLLSFPLRKFLSVKSPRVIRVVKIGQCVSIQLWFKTLLPAAVLPRQVTGGQIGHLRSWRTYPERTNCYETFSLLPLATCPYQLSCSHHSNEQDENKRELLFLLFFFSSSHSWSCKMEDGVRKERKRNMEREELQGRTVLLVTQDESFPEWNLVFARTRWSPCVDEEARVRRSMYMHLCVCVCTFLACIFLSCA